jgi:hypothetical protein
MARYVCSWCEKEGVKTYLNDIIFEGEHDSHGICRKHLDEIMKSMKAFDAIKEHNEGVNGNDKRDKKAVRNSK